MTYGYMTKVSFKLCVVQWSLNIQPYGRKDTHYIDRGVGGLQKFNVVTGVEKEPVELMLLSVHG